MLAYWILKGYRRKVDDDLSPPKARGEETMVRCAQCGVHLPRSESISTDGQYFCSAEHKHLHQTSSG